ncbi:MAG: TOBE domain-containing protein, partial [Gemmatimonadaceae bacterium]
LDAGLRAQMRIEIGGLQRRLQTTTVYVTHDQVEAMTLGDRIVVLADGRIQQVGKPIELYRSPVNKFVAGFIGTPPMNFIDGRIVEDDGAARFIAEGVRVKLAQQFGGRPEFSQSVTLGIRPEDMDVDSGDDPSSGSTEDTIPGKVVLIERLGGTSHVHFDAGPHRLMASVSNDRLPEVGDTIIARLRAERAHLFGADGRTVS